MGIRVISVDIGFHSHLSCAQSSNMACNVHYFACVHGMQVDGSGQVLDFLMDGDGAQVSSVSAVSESPDGKLWLGNLVGSYVSYIDLAAPSAS